MIVPRIDWSGVFVWLLGFGLVAYLGLEGGGYDPLVHDQVGIAVWWVLLATVAVGALPRRRLGAVAWGALALLAAFAGWTALSLSWTESAERTSAEVARVSLYLGVFVLALFAREARSMRRLVAAVGTGIALVAFVALLSRLHPAWFPEASQTGDFIAGEHERLSYPLNYWNGLAALIAIGLPLMLHAATSGRSVLLRSLAAATLPALALTIFLTLSRGGMATAIVAIALFLALSRDRLPKLLTALLAGGGGAILIAATVQRDALQHGALNALARDQGSEVLAMTLVVCAGVGLVQAGLSLGLIRGLRPRWASVSREQSVALVLVGLAAAVVVAIAVGAPGRTADAIEDFQQRGSPGRGTERLSSASGQGRYQLWSSAVRQNASEPLLGTGPGTFQYWWTRDGDLPVIVRDAHSLYLQVLGELGIVGLVLLLAFLVTVLGAGVRTALRADFRRRGQVVAAVAGCVAFSLSAAFDWTWQVPVLPVAFLVLAAALVSAGSGAERGALPPLARAGFGLAAIAAIAAIATPLASSSLVRESQRSARQSELSQALTAAERAEAVQPEAATPRLQQALILEAGGNMGAAAEEARAATARESTNWEPWLVLSRLEAERGRAAAALRAYRKAKSLNPRSQLFTR